ncbi:hypothetical protein ACSFA2_03575 [Variovorax sp. LT2P21]|uniref:hypothetical protein n=1 Tax=Variovorax sp. LT2P21 TaxID=3443731 RepID=UPI003F45678A
MVKVSTRPQETATAVTSAVTSVTAAQPPLTPPPRLTVASAKDVPPIEFDSTAVDILIARTEEIQALGSCAMCLTAVQNESGDFAKYELTDSALPLLCDVIKRLAAEANAAAQVLWEQYRQALSAANGKEYSA